MRLILVLHWLRSYPKYDDLAELYEISRQQVHREIMHILPLLAAHLNEIDWPTDYWNEHPFEQVVGAIDCSAHLRNRPSHQRQYYRSDKHRCLLLAQVVCNMRGQLMDVQLLKGHNNDQGAFNLTGTNLFLDENNVQMLADGGYRHPMLVTPQHDDMPVAWNREQSATRSVVERTIGYVKGYAAAVLPFKQLPAIQTAALLAIYQLSNINLKQFPLQ